MKRLKVLIVRFRRVGDAVLTSSLCTTLKQSNPNIIIHYVLDEPIGCLFENHPDIDRVITFSAVEKHTLFKYIRKVWSLVRREKYDVIIDTRSTVNTLLFSLFSLNSKYRIGLKKSYTKFILNHRFDIERTTGYIENFQRLLSPLNREFIVADNRNFRLVCTDADKMQFRHRMISHGIDFQKPVICCAVATRIIHKRWPIQKMKTALQFLIFEYDAQLVFNYSGEEETAYAYELYREMNYDSHIFIDIKAENIKELVEMISNCNFFFGNEGGPRHISQALNIPSFAIFPPGIPKSVWLPERSVLFGGIEPADIDKDVSLSPTISYSDKFNLITAYLVIVRIKAILSMLKIFKVNVKESASIG